MLRDRLYFWLDRHLLAVSVSVWLGALALVMMLGLIVHRA